MNSSKTAQHTPGGLHVWDDPETARIQLRSGSHTVASVHINGFQGPKQALEFARLIAAAPDLLRALKMYRDILIGAKKPVSPIITDAIAKAEGGAA